MAVFVGLGILLSIVSLVVTVKFGRFMFHFGIGALFLQILLFVQWSDLIYGSLSDPGSYFGVLMQINPGLLWTFTASIFPFPIPLGLAYLVGSTTVNPQFGIISFFFFSLAQVILLGLNTKSAAKTESFLKAVTAYAIPLFMFLINVVNLFLPGEKRIDGFAPDGNLLIIGSLCCCLGVVLVIILIAIVVRSGRKK